ncbi:MAG: putative baseplate assembly protein [Acidimicrobiales bacterium]|nr:putative baseplate assembly protein [Acidimicrobiales bacterium]
MSLPVPNLDDRRFQDIVDEAKRLIPQFCPEWTNHNVSDPGVALIELFAWMTEMMLYRLNQVPDAYYVRFLNLMGVEPFPPAAAVAELTFWLSGVPTGQVVVPAGTQVSTTGEEADRFVFTTIDDLVIGQPRIVAAMSAIDDSSWLDVTEQLGYQRARVELFRSQPPEPDDAFYLGVASSLAGNVIRLEIEADAEGIGVDPTRPPLAFEVWGDEAWIGAAVHSDTTGGLNRSGEIVLLVPSVHEPLTLADVRGFWLRIRVEDVAADQPTYRRSPRLTALRAAAIGGTTAAEHSEAVGRDLLGVSDGRPGQIFTVRHAPVLPRRRHETVRVSEPDGDFDWVEVGDFAQSSPTDRHLRWDSATGEIRFGPRIRYPDGTHRQHGAVPPAGSHIHVLGYRHGGGSRGNVGAGTLTALRSAIPFVSHVTNLTPATGGVDAESVDNAKLRGPATVRTGERAVTAADFERLSLAADATLARARCLPPSRPGDPVRLLLVPGVEALPNDYRLDDFALTDRLVDNVRDHLDARRVLGTTIELSTPYYQGVSVAALLRALPGRSEAVIGQRARDLLYRLINPLCGGTDGHGWPFDTDLNAAAVSQLLGSIDGVDRVEEVLFFEFDLRNGTRTGRALDIVRLAPDSLFLSAAHRVVVR